MTDENGTRTRGTPGPWIVRDCRKEGFSRIEILGPPDERSKHRHGRCHIVEMRGWANSADAEEVLADARRIAAVPAMEAALEASAKAFEFIAVNLGCSMDAEGADEETHCSETGACITEWCLGCYAEVHAKNILALSRGERDGEVDHA